MPVMDGLMATRSIREQELLMGRRTPILALTAHVLQRDQKLCLDAGMDAYLSKPIDSEKLLAALRYWGNRPRPFTA
jgi:CheY-like chemotaxis protein